jgi:hypothetical protein
VDGVFKGSETTVRQHNPTPFPNPLLIHCALARVFLCWLSQRKGLDMLHAVVLATSDPVAAGFILRGIKGIFVAVGSVIAAVVCGLIALTKGRNPLGWGILGLFFSILTLIVIIVVPSKK